MFQLVDIPEVTVDVEFSVPGQEKTGEIKATWKLLKRDQLQEFRDRLAEGNTTDEQFMEEMLVKLGGIGDGQGNELDDTPELRAAVAQENYVIRPLLMSFWTAQQGRERHVAKN